MAVRTRGLGRLFDKLGALLGPSFPALPEPDFSCLCMPDLDARIADMDAARIAHLDAAEDLQGKIEDLLEEKAFRIHSDDMTGHGGPLPARA